MRVATYYRVSTKGQGEDDKLGLPTQRAAVERFCRKHGYEIVEAYEDIGASGATADRLGLARMLADAASKRFSAVVVYKWDRIARNTTLDGFLRYRFAESGVTALSATEENGHDPASNLTQQILRAVAEFERSLIAQRLSAARRLKKERGGYAHGRPRYGMKAQGGQLVPDRSEIETINLARSLRRERNTYRGIAAELNARQVPTKSGKPWGASSVHIMLSRRNASHRGSPMASELR